MDPPGHGRMPPHPTSGAGWKCQEGGIPRALHAQDEKERAELSAGSVALPRFKRDESLTCPTGMGWGRHLFPREALPHGDREEGKAVSVGH